MDNHKARNIVIATLIAGPLLICSGGVYLVTRKVDYIQESMAIDAELAKAKAAGFPMTREEVEPFDVPDDQNAMPLYASLLTKWPEKWPDKQIDERSKKRETNTESFPEFDAVLQAIRSKPKLKLNKDWDLNTEVYYPELVKAKRLAKVSSMRAIAAARRGDVQQVKTELDTTALMSSHFLSSPIQIPVLVGIAINGMTTDAAVNAVVASEGNPEVVAIAKSRLNAQIPPVDWEHVVHGEFYMGLSLARNMHLLPKNPDSEPKPYAWTKNPIRTGTPKLRRVRALLSTFTRHSVEMSRLLAEENSNPDLPKILDDYTENIPATMSNMISHILIPFYGSSIKAERRMTHRSQVALATIDLFLSIRKTKRVPASLIDAGISTVDPNTGRPLKMSVNENRVTVYSVGHNKRDEGGPPTRGKESDDFGYSFVLPGGAI